MSGWFQVSHDLMEDEALDGKAPYSVREALIWLHHKALFSPRQFYSNGRLVDVSVRQVLVSNTKLMKQFGWSKGHVRSFLQRMQVAGHFDVDTDQGTTVLTIRNPYEKKEDVAEKSPTLARKKTDIKHQYNNKNKNKLPSTQETKIEPNALNPSSGANLENKGSLQRSGAGKAPVHKTRRVFVKADWKSVGDQLLAGPQTAASASKPAYATRRSRPAPNDASDFAPSRFTSDIDGTMPPTVRAALNMERSQNTLVQQARADAAKRMEKK